MAQAKKGIVAGSRGGKRKTNDGGASAEKETNAAKVGETSVGAMEVDVKVTKNEAGEKKKSERKALHVENGGHPPASFLSLDAEADNSKLAGKKRKKSSSSLSSVGAALGGSEIKSRVIYIGRIPHGFYEDQMAGFFGQFGTITRLRMSRNKKTGKPKHFAFLEFESPEVAAIVAECMHNYLLFSSILQVRLVPPEKIHPTTWVGANRKFHVVNRSKMAREQFNKERTLGEEQTLLKRRLRSEERRNEKLKAFGIDYQFLGLKDLLPPAPAHTKFEDTEPEELTAAVESTPPPAKKRKGKAKGQ